MLWTFVFSFEQDIAQMHKYMLDQKKHFPLSNNKVYKMVQKYYSIQLRKDTLLVLCGKNGQKLPSLVDSITGLLSLFLGRLHLNKLDPVIVTSDCQRHARAIKTFGKLCSTFDIS